LLVSRTMILDFPASRAVSQQVSAHQKLPIVFTVATQTGLIQHPIYSSRPCVVLGKMDNLAMPSQSISQSVGVCVGGGGGCSVGSQ
jgi:hypothetical protein